MTKRIRCSLQAMLIGMLVAACSTPAASSGVNHGAHGGHAVDLVANGGNAAAPAAVVPVASRPGKPAVARTPEELLQLLGERIVAKDVEGIIALQEPNAAIIDWDLTVIQGHDAIRAFYIEWFKSNPVLTVNPQQVFVSGGQRGNHGSVINRTGSIMGTYSLTQDAAGGGRETFTGNFCDIVREQKNGTWLYLQDNPYPPHGDPSGTAAAHPRR